MRKGQVEVARMIKLIGIAIVVILVVSTLLGAIAVIGAGHRGVLLTWGKVEPRILGEGISTITPYMNQVVPISVQTQKYSATASSASADLQIVTTEVTLNYHLEPEKVNTIYQTLQLDWENRVIQPAIQEAVKASTARYTAEELITKRPIVKESIDQSVKDKLTPYGLVTETIYITDFKFSPDFENAIEQKVTAVQLAQKAENDLARIKIEAQQTIETAKGFAESIRIQGQALKENPQLVNLKAVEKWNGILPTMLIMGGQSQGGNIPSLILPVSGS
jgi:regulator of protease activity HflC (stomatin/prohibitin superfamily)